jgi:hypothetical protein
LLLLTSPTGGCGDAADSTTPDAAASPDAPASCACPAGSSPSSATLCTTAESSYVVTGPEGVVGACIASPGCEQYYCQLDAACACGGTISSSNQFSCNPGGGGSDCGTVVSAVVLQWEATPSTTYDHADYDNFVPGALEAATQGLVRMSIDAHHVLPLPPQSASHDYASQLDTYPWLVPGDEVRLWYYDQGFDRIVLDLRAAIANAGLDLLGYDLIVILSDVQFEGIAVEFPSAFVRPAVLLNTLSIGGWGVGANYYRGYSTPYQYADESIHEVGHFMGLKHACESCSPTDEACCNACASKDDVMSYCRSRPLEGDTFHNVFGTCTLAFIEDHFVPEFASGETSMQVAACN